METIQASPTKLRSGKWGAKTTNTDVQKGDTLQITTRGGKSWTAQVSCVVWVGEGVAICATESTDRSPSRRPRRRSKWCECGACDDLMSIGYRPGERITCEDCGGIAEAG